MGTVGTTIRHYLSDNFGYNYSTLTESDAYSLVKTLSLGHQKALAAQVVCEVEGNNRISDDEERDIDRLWSELKSGADDYLEVARMRWQGYGENTIARRDSSKLTGRYTQSYNPARTAGFCMRGNDGTTDGFGPSRNQSNVTGDGFGNSGTTQRRRTTTSGDGF
jgi:hypothetical protein